MAGPKNNGALAGMGGLRRRGFECLDFFLSIFIGMVDTRKELGGLKRCFELSNNYMSNRYVGVA